jgi:hypothetical protein
MSMAISGLSNMWATDSSAAVQSGQSTNDGTNPLFQALSSTLGLSASAIQQQLASGSSLTQIASQQGVSKSTLVSAVESALAQGPGQNMSSTQLAQMANTIVNTTGLPSGPGSSSSDGSGSSSAGPGNQGTTSSGSQSTEFLIQMLMNQSQSQASNGSFSDSSSAASSQQYFA